MLIAKRALQRQLGSEASEWATDQLMQGRDTPHLRQLAGTTGIENRFELDELFDRVLHELDLSLPTRNQAVLIYAQELGHDYLDGKVMLDQLLEETCDLCISTDYMRELSPFYNIRGIRDDLTRENFEELVRAEIMTLLANG